MQSAEGPSDVIAQPTAAEVQATKQANMTTSAKELTKRHKHDPMNAEGAGKPGVVKATKIQAGKRGKGKAAKKNQSTHQSQARESPRGGYKQ